MVEVKMQNPDISNEVAVHGRYEKIGERYVLRAFRIVVTTEGLSSYGEWQKVHGNRRRGVGALPLVCDTLPVGPCFTLVS